MQTMTAAQALENAKGMTFEAFWASLMEYREQKAEEDKRYREQKAEEDRRYREQKAEEDRRYREQKAEENKRYREQKAEEDKRYREQQAEDREQLRLLRESQREMAAKTDAYIEKLVAETNAQIAKLTKENEKFSKNLGGVSNTVGDLEEVIFASRLWEKFPQYKLQRAYRNIPIYDERNDWRGEIDILLVDTEWSMAVEVKSHAKAKHIEQHEKRMELIRKYPPFQFNAPKLLGAIAAGFISPEVRKMAMAAGFFVLELNGDQMDLINPPPDFEPKEW
jgi:DNA repair exonuclease SbcCD ATPase subunit